MLTKINIDFFAQEELSAATAQSNATKHVNGVVLANGLRGFLFELQQLRAGLSCVGGDVSNLSDLHHRICR